VVGLEVDGAPFFLHEVNPKNPSEDSPDPLGITSTRIELFVDDPERFMELGRVETLISSEADFYLGREEPLGDAHRNGDTACTRHRSRQRTSSS